MLEFFDIKPLEGTASLYSTFITLNKSMANCLADAYRVRVAISKEKNEIYLFKINKSQALSGEYNESSLLKVGISKSYARICSRAMMDFVFNSLDFSLEENEYLRYKSIYDDEKNCIIIKVGEVIN